ncbi:MAG: L-asparaginase II [Chlamydiales bacterium]|jgi:L-asparaginase II
MTGSTTKAAGGYPENPVLVRVWRGDHVESQHRGAWVLVDPDGEVLAGEGQFERPFFVRSSIKAVQALPLLESGAAERFQFTDLELALALSSHNAEAMHTDCVAGLLARLDLGVGDLRCGAQSPLDPRARAALQAAGESATALHNNCSGKHAGFLALARHLATETSHYLDPQGEVQKHVRRALAEMSDLQAGDLQFAIDGCSAPTYLLPLRALATLFARVSNPAALAPERRAACERMLAAVAANPDAIAGRHKRLCTALVRAGRGRLFPKIGAEGVYGIGIAGADCALAIKLDDGGLRGLHAVVLHLLERFGHLDGAQLEELAGWRPGVLSNWAGLAVGRVEVIDHE